MFLKFHQDITGRNSICYEFYAHFVTISLPKTEGKKRSTRDVRSHINIKHGAQWKAAEPRGWWAEKPTTQHTEENKMATMLW